MSKNFFPNISFFEIIKNEKNLNFFFFFTFLRGNFWDLLERRRKLCSEEKFLNDLKSFLWILSNYLLRRKSPDWFIVIKLTHHSTSRSQKYKQSFFWVKTIDFFKVVICLKKSLKLVGFCWEENEVSQWSRMSIKRANGSRRIFLNWRELRLNNLYVWYFQKQRFEYLKKKNFYFFFLVKEILTSKKIFAKKKFQKKIKNFQKRNDSNSENNFLQKNFLFNFF